jgi:hypothetical protein
MPIAASELTGNARRTVGPAALPSRERAANARFIPSPLSASTKTSPGTADISTHGLCNAFDPASPRWVMS